MDIKKITDLVKSVVIKYKYAAIVLLVGIALLVLPQRNVTESEAPEEPMQPVTNQHLKQETLAEILQTIDGAGKVQVLLSVAQGEETRYQTDSDTNGETIKIETVVLSDSQRGEYGLIRQVNPPVYLGAIVVCQGADSPAVKLAVTQAVTKITGLGADNVCVLKMK